MKYILALLVMLLIQYGNCYGQSEVVLITNGDTISLNKLDTLRHYSTTGKFKGYGINHGDSTISFYFGEDISEKTDINCQDKTLTK